MITCDDVLTCFKDHWDGDASLTADVPGGLWFGRAPQGASFPYAVATIEAADPEWTSGPYWQTFTVRVAVYAAAESDEAADVQGHMATRFRWSQADMTVAGGDVVGCRPLAVGAELDSTLRQASDVLIARGAWELTVSGS